MKYNQLFTIHLAVTIIANDVHCFTIDSKDKIAPEPGTIVVSDKQVFLPLGWPAKLLCDSAYKLEDINFQRTKPPTWKVRFPSGEELVAIESGSKELDISDSSLNISPATQGLDGTIVECIVDRSGNTSLLSRYRVETQDCKSQSPEDTNAYNLHNPCAYGKCQVVRKVVECLCFKQYTGRHCDIEKPSSTLLDVLPYLMAVAFPILYFVITFVFSLVQEDRKQEKLMGISELIGHSNRSTFQHSTIYPFVRKLRRCEFSESEDSEEEDESEEQFMDTVQNAYQLIRDGVFSDTDSKGAALPENPAIKATNADAGNTTGGTTVDVSTTGSAMNTVSGTISGTISGAMSGAATSKILDAAGSQGINSRRTNKKKGKEPKSKAEPAIEPIPEVVDIPFGNFPEDSVIG
ncbi:hypothetical protein GCK72_013982 [Caenorhabditis remanei]|uniref:EGF-like domain-containing protein n=1 Tax=Caenorhabditis remanei TaxID=31234 RepID=A0A6A5GSI4_CAERE|nr:hypothetical protein GCK72_013982 [Caenorhabditis remanei]KAF1757526.1 hypothetical protein GCK72_013982 [Caenorhabditis remanei]